MSAVHQRACSAHYVFPDAALLVFAKAPIAGRAKTRLIAKLGARGAARLHARLTRQVLSMATRARLAPVRLCYSPARTHGFFHGCRRDFALGLQVQYGKDLGQRMHHALSHALRHHDCAILIGSDCPGLAAPLLRAAFNALQGDADVVLVPASDGGYVLIGMRRAAAVLFQGVDWGSARVLVATRRRIQKLGWRCAQFTPLNDIDRPADLQGLPRGPGGLLFDLAPQ